MSSTTSFLGLTKPAASENYDISVQNGNLDKIDTAASKTNKKLPYCSTLAALQTAIIAAVGELSNGEIACGYCDVGFSDGAKGIDGSKGSYLLLRQSADVFSIHIFFGTSEAVAYYHSAAWHWQPGPKGYVEDITSQTNVTIGKIYFVRAGGSRQLVAVDAVLPSNAQSISLPTLASEDRPQVSTMGFFAMNTGSMLYIWARADGLYGQANGAAGATLNGNLVWFAT